MASELNPCGKKRTQQLIAGVWLPFITSLTYYLLAWPPLVRNSRTHSSISHSGGRAQKSYIFLLRGSRNGVAHARPERSSYLSASYRLAQSQIGHPMIYSASLLAQLVSLGTRHSHLYRIPFRLHKLACLPARPNRSRLSPTLRVPDSAPSLVVSLLQDINTNSGSSPNFSFRFNFKLGTSLGIGLNQAKAFLFQAKLSLSSSPKRDGYSQFGYSGCWLAQQ